MQKKRKNQPTWNRDIRVLLLLLPTCTDFRIVSGVYLFRLNLSENEATSCVIWHFIFRIIYWITIAPGVTVSRNIFKCFNFVLGLLLFPSKDMFVMPQDHEQPLIMKIKLFFICLSTFWCIEYKLRFKEYSLSSSDLEKSLLHQITCSHFLSTVSYRTPEHSREQVIAHFRFFCIVR